MVSRSNNFISETKYMKGVQPVATLSVVSGSLLRDAIVRFSADARVLGVSTIIYGQDMLDT